MSERISTMKIISTDGMTDLERIDSQLQALILNTEGTIPGSRSFGLAREFLSRPPLEARNLFAIELEEKVEEYIPDITINSVEASSDITGLSDFKIYIERRE